MDSWGVVHYGLFVLYSARAGFLLPGELWRAIYSRKNLSYKTSVAQLNAFSAFIIQTQVIELPNSFQIMNTFLQKVLSNKECVSPRFLKKTANIISISLPQREDSQDVPDADTIIRSANILFDESFLETKRVNPLVTLDSGFSTFIWFNAFWHLGKMLPARLKMPAAAAYAGINAVYAAYYK